MNLRLLHQDTWKNKLGLFPVPLFKDKFKNEKFILLNGGRRGNIVIDFMEINETEARNFAWSSDIGHYLRITNDTVYLNRWDIEKRTKFRTSDVVQNLNKFYTYLREQNIDGGDSIVNFSIYFYRQIVQHLKDSDGVDSINALLYLFACIVDGTEVKKLKSNEWGLNPKTKSLFNTSNGNFGDKLIEDFQFGLTSKDLKPDINLILRHAAGKLFQEAHSETIFSSQFNLFDESRSIVKRKPNNTTAHFTPRSIVRTIVEEVLNNYDFRNKNEIVVLDPACGSGEFLKEFIRQIRLKGYTEKIKIIGWDTSPIAVNMANFIINYERKNDNNIDVSITLNDALENWKNWAQVADFILMNPPFISFEIMNKTQKIHVADILSDLTSSRPNMAGAFLWNAIKSIKNNGKIGCVLPTSIFENDSYLELRNNLKNLIDIEIIGRLGSHSIFADALVDAAILVGTKRSQFKSDPLVIWSDYKSDSGDTALRELRKLRYSEKEVPFSNKENYSLYKNQEIINGESWIPIPYNSFSLLNKINAQNFPKVEDIFDVHQGARTGLNMAFIVSKDFFNTLSKNEKKFFRPAVTNESIDKGQLTDNSYVFYPHTEEWLDGIKNNTLENLVPKFYKMFLLPNKIKLSNRSGINKWWEMTRPRNWQKGIVPKIVSKEFGKAGDFAYDNEGLYISERSHAWLPKDYELDDIGYAYICVLSMPKINDFLAGLSKQIGGGQWYLSSKFINKMPIPNLFTIQKIENSFVTELIILGKRISKGVTIDAEELNNYSRIIYGK